VEKGCKMEEKTMGYFPFFVALNQKKCLVVGGGTVALRRTKRLIEFEAEVIVVAPSFLEEFYELEEKHLIKRRNRKVQAEDLNGMEIVLAATNQREQNHWIGKLCKSKGIWFNAADSVQESDFLFPACINRSPVVIGITTSGKSPVLAKEIRKKVERLIDKTYEETAKELGNKREQIKASGLNEVQKKEVFYQLAKKFLLNQTMISKGENMSMKRTRRLRASEEMRGLVRETCLSVSDLIYPIFVIEGEKIKNPVESMPGIYQYSIDRLEEELERIVKSGIKGILIFGIPKKKDETGSQAYAKDGITQRAIRFIKQRCPKLLVIADVCLCEYTSHGHCGLIRGEKILNDETLVYLSKAAVSLAEAGADMIAPSDMMDGRVAAIRAALDEAGMMDIPIMSYSAKYASGYYSPFRDAAHSAPSFGDRKTYQMDYGNGKEAILEMEIDLEEGADILMVKPGLPYLDVLKEASQKFFCPLAVYHVSGEYSMIKAASEKGWIDEKKIVMEQMTAMKRAGAKIIISYYALQAAEWIREDRED